MARYIERLTKTPAAPSVKQLLAGIRMLFNWFVVGQIVAHESPRNFNYPVWLLGLGELLKKSYGVLEALECLDLSLEGCCSFSITGGPQDLVYRVANRRWV